MKNEEQITKRITHLTNEIARIDNLDPNRRIYEIDQDARQKNIAALNALKWVLGRTK